MSRRLRKLLIETAKVFGLAVVFLFLQEQVIQVRHDLHGSANGIALAQTRYSEELDETRRLIRNALEDSHLQFRQARRVFQESTELIQDERRELARLIDDRTVALASTIHDRLETDRTLLEGARGHAESSAALVQKLERALDQDVQEMKRKMIYPTVQLRGSGTVGSGVIIYSGPAPGGEPSGARGLETFVLTAQHVVMEVMGDKASKGVVEEIRVLGQNDVFDPEVFAGEVLLSDRERDLALIKLRTTRRFPHIAELATRETLGRLDVFTRAYAVGCPLGNRPLPTVGEISSKNKLVGDQVFWMLNAPTFFGNSGGGVYLASSCQLIGISSMVYTYGREAPTVVPHMGLFVSLEAIAAWLEAEGFSFLLGSPPALKP